MINLLALLDPLPSWLPAVAAGMLLIWGVVITLWRDLVAAGFWLAVWGILSRGPLSDAAETVDVQVAALLSAF